MYSPKTFAYVLTHQGKTVDLTPYIVSGEVHRRVNQVSSAELVCRNPNRQFTSEQGKPTFHPMDRITIYLQRLPGHPVQVFTGYIDKAPYYQMYPGTMTITASCTLKRVQYTWWDPALPFMISFMKRYGWEVNPSTGQAFTIPNASGAGAGTGQVQVEAKRSHAIASLLEAVLVHIANWPEKQVYIEELPDVLIRKLPAIFNKYNKENKEIEQHLNAYFKAIVGSGGGAGGGASGAGVPKGAIIDSRLTKNQAIFGGILAGLMNFDPGVIAAWMLSEESGGPAQSRESANNNNWLNIGYFDSGPGAITKGGVWGSPQSAAQATYDFLAGKKFGASQGIRNILNAAGKGKDAEISAIANAGWATDPNYGANISALYRPDQTQGSKGLGSSGSVPIKK